MRYNYKYTEFINNWKPAMMGKIWYSVDGKICESRAESWFNGDI